MYGEETVDRENRSFLEVELETNNATAMDRMSGQPPVIMAT